MILIFSKFSDQSTNDVMKYLSVWGHSFVRINEYTEVEFNLNIFNKSESYLIVDGAKIALSNITSVWVRKGAYFKSLRDSQINTVEVAEFMFNEERVFYSVISSQLYGKRLLNSFNQIYFCKIEALQKAKEIGINVPDSTILNSVNLLKKATKKSKIITKPLFNIIDTKSKLSMLTRLISEDDSNGLPSFFYPSLVQAYIHTIYEIRSVYLLGEIYSCILVPRYKTNNLPDYRGSIYGDLGLEPIKTNAALKRKIISLMEKLEINFCSLDLLVDEDEQYHLIDINPFGQYGMVSVKYNNIIDIKIAKYLGNE